MVVYSTFITRPCPVVTCINIISPLTYCKFLFMSESPPLKALHVAKENLCSSEMTEEIEELFVFTEDHTEDFCIQKAFI